MRRAFGESSSPPPLAKTHCHVSANSSSQGEDIAPGDSHWCLDSSTEGQGMVGLNSINASDSDRVIVTSTTAPGASSSASMQMRPSNSKRNLWRSASTNTSEGDNSRNETDLLARSFATNRNTSLIN